MKIKIALLFSIVLLSCNQIKQVGLYDEQEEDKSPNINGFYAVRIFKDQITNDVWYTEPSECIQVSAAKDEGIANSGAISIDWNKQATNCPWLGMGIGWENWSGKNLESVIKNAGLSFWVKMKQGESRGLPWAVGFEDFNGGQAWTGATEDCIVGGIVKGEWTQVIIPLENFPFENTSTDYTSIKQVMFQFESSGKLWIDEISLVPVESKKAKSTTVKSDKAPAIDGKLSDGEWPAEKVVVQDAEIKLNWDNKYLYIAAEVRDESPLMNNKEGQDIWNGDALEIAFSTQSDLDNTRKIFYSSDHHIGIRASSTPVVFDWSKETSLGEALVITKANEKGYVLEAAIPWSSLNAQPWDSNKAYNFEIALDKAGENFIRTSQYRWNSVGKDGFNFNPSLWGTLYTQF